MKSLLTLTALIEGATGLALVIVPSMVVSSLLGTILIDPTSILLAKLAGITLITIGLACWFSRTELTSTFMVKAMLGYNLFSISLLVYSALIENLYGLGLWPAVLLHLGLLFWCISALRKQMNKGNAT